MTANIMIVTDSTLSRNNFYHLIKKQGYLVTGDARTGTEAVEKYLGINPDMVFIDLNISVMDGIETTRQIKKLDPDARIAVCSHIGEASKVKESVEAGAVDFLLMPFDEKRVIQSIRRFMKK